MSGLRMQRSGRILSVVAAAVVSLACGTNYAYSAWAPEFGDRLKLSSTQENLIGTFGNLGTYLLGIPLGMVVDTRGPRPGLALGAVCLGVGYLCLLQSYKAGSESASMPWLCFFSFLTGVGSCSGFLSAVKACAVNWPKNRGAATGIALAAYGLSAFFFTIMSHIAFADDTAGLLLFFTIATFSMVVVGGIFVRIVPQSHNYTSVSGNTELDDSASIGKFIERGGPEEPGMQSESAAIDDPASKDHSSFKEPEDRDLGSEETSSLLSKSSADPTKPSHTSPGTKEEDEDDSRNLDVRGFALLSKVNFWQIWLSTGILTGIGLMTINNIGSDNRAIWHHYDDSAPSTFIQERQMMHVEVLSFASFCGRLSSGVGSDLIVTRLRMSRYWCLLASALVFLIAQICAFNIQTPQPLPVVSVLNGLGYGILFGVGPALVVDAFGITGLSQNWGVMTLAPILFGNIFNLIYGDIYDSHSITLPNGSKDCPDGYECYRMAYLVTMCASVLGVLLAIWSIRHDYVGKLKKGRERDTRHQA